jgi:RHS repeat-associated protein
MLAAPTRAPALPVFPLAALPFASVTTSTTEFLFAKKPHWGLGGKVPIWEPRFLYANHQTPLGLPVSSYDSGRRSRCTGKERDAETGLDYFGARYFSAAQGRFTSPDEFKGGIADAFTGNDIETNTALPYADITDPQTLNKYAYVRNNPLRYTDPDGHCLEDLCAVEGTVVAAGSSAILTGAAWVAGAVGATGLAITLHNGADTINSGIRSFGSAISSIFTKSDKKPGTLGKPDHQQTADEEAAKFGEKGQREVKVDTPGGEKGSRKIDAAKVENGKVTEATQVIRPNKDGTAPAREVRAAKDIERATGVKPKLVPVRPLKPAGSQ